MVANGGRLKTKDMINEMCVQVHADNCKKGFWDEDRELGTTLMLVVSEIAEALEADRKGRWATEEPYKDTFEDEIADTFIRLMDLCGRYQIDIDKHIAWKLEYNRGRAYKHGKSY